LPPARPEKPTGKKAAKPKDDGIRKVRADMPVGNNIRKVKADLP
jgi:hypothetical protein